MKNDSLLLEFQSVSESIRGLHKKQFTWHKYQVNIFIDKLRYDPALAIALEKLDFINSKKTELAGRMLILYQAIAK